MYAKFYNLEEKPFELTPSPRFLYLGDTHREALATLTYGVMERKGFVMLTGEVGTGKTTIVQALLGNLDETARPIYVSNPILELAEFFDYLGSTALGKKVHYASKAEFLVEFEDILRKCSQDGKNLILIIDEAHKLSFELMEELRLLSNLESPEAKLMSIFLIGQPELIEKLNEPRCRPLLQRIGLRYRVAPLGFEDTKAYLETRLRVAGLSETTKLFSQDAIKSIHELSGGYPRMINILADNALLLGYSRGAKTINANIIRACYQDLNPAVSDAPPLAEPASEPKTEAPEIAPPPTRSSSRRWIWAVLGLAILAAGYWFLYPAAMDLMPHKPPLPPEAQDSTHPRPPEPAPVIKQPIERPTESPTIVPPESGPIPPRTDQAQTPAVPAGSTEPPRPSAETAPAPERDWQPVASITVKEGDSLPELATETYGRVDSAILTLVKEHNPQIEDADRIELGQVIDFPPLPVTPQEPTYTVHVGSYKPFEFALDLFKSFRQKNLDAHIVVARNTPKGKVFRVTLGRFQDLETAEAYAARVLKEGISPYAQAIRLEAS